MVEAGVELVDVLAAATINNAKRFNLQAHYGTVESGKVANVLLLNKNPLETIGAWDSIEFVILHGQVIERESLTVQNMANKTLRRTSR